MATLPQKLRLLQGLLTGERAKTGPFYIGIDLTNHCNVGCLGCQYHSSLLKKHRPPRGRLSFELFRRLLDQLKQVGTEQLVLQGAGEPLLHPQAVEMVQLAKAMGFNVMLLTNGTLLDQQTVEALVDARLDTLKLSLWAASVEQYERNYPGVDTKWFRRAVEGGKLLISVRGKRTVPKVIVHHVITRPNHRELASVVDLAASLGCDGMSFGPMHSAASELDGFVLDDQEERVALQAMDRARRRHPGLVGDRSVEELRLRYQMKDASQWRQPCYVAWFLARISVDGSVLPCSRCEDLSFGNLNHASFQEIWNGAAVRTFRREMLAAENPTRAPQRCRCDNCCHIGNNVQVHRVFRWLRPLQMVRARVAAGLW